MKVLVNGTPMLAPLTGIGRYVRQLFEALDELALLELSFLYGLQIERGFRPPDPKTCSRAQSANRWIQNLVPFPRSTRRFLQKTFFRHHTRQSYSDAIYHEPNYLPMPFDGPMVLTVCDLSTFDCPQSHPIERVRLLDKHLPKALSRADEVIVISEDSRRALKRWFNVPDYKITTTYLAADTRFRPLSIESVQTILQSFGLDWKSYVLCVGTLEPRKNLEVLFEAFAQLPDFLRRRFPLVVAGMRGWHSDSLIQRARELLSRGELRLLGHVEDALMPHLYAGAAAFCYPSRYEGFGLPALEAMAAGVPVITSNRTSLPEVVGQAGLMCDPDDVSAMSNHLASMLEDQSLACRLSAAGLERAASFSWHRCASETLAVYQRAAGRKGMS